MCSDYLQIDYPLKGGYYAQANYNTKGISARSFFIHPEYDKDTKKNNIALIDCGSQCAFAGRN